MKGLAGFLDVHGVAKYRETTAYLPGEIPVTLRSLPTEPDKAVAVTAYSTDDELTLPVRTVYVQFRFRAGGSRTDVDDFAEEVFDILQGKHQLSLPNGVLVSRARRVNAAPRGVDDNGRAERAGTYELLLQRPWILKFPRWQIP